MSYLPLPPSPRIAPILSLLGTETSQSRRSGIYTQEWVDNTAESAKSGRVSEPEGQDEQRLATRLYNACVQTFKEFCRNAAQPTLAESQQTSPHELSTINLRKDQMARFVLWGDGFRDGNLDKALHQSEDLRRTALELLSDIAVELQKRRWLQPSHRRDAFPTETLKEMNILADQCGTIIARDRFDSIRGNEDDHSTISSISSLSDCSEGEMPGVGDVLESTIRNLLNLAPIIENNLIQAEREDLTAQLINASNFSVSQPAQIYVSHVRDKFRNAPTRLVERLGEANWQRHIVIRSNMLEKSGASKDKETILAAFEPKSIFHDSGLGTSVTASSHRAASMASHTSFVSTAVGREQGNVRVPPTPLEISAGKPFTCFICGHIQKKLKNRVDWKMHVFADLQPYLCTSSTCSQVLVQYSTRKTWAEHEFSEHHHRQDWKQAWECSTCSENDMDLEQSRRHGRSYYGHIVSQIPPKVSLGLAPDDRGNPVLQVSCPLCCVYVSTSRRDYVKHVGRHMEDIALMALPKDDEDSDGLSIDDFAPSDDSGEGDRLPINDFDISDGLRGKGPLSARSDPLYTIKPRDDGLYQCSYVEDGQSCDHAPFKLKCNYDKHLDSHLRPYRCKTPGCNEGSFSSTACLIRHEREAHGMHNHKEVLCKFADCDRSRPGKGFPRKWNAHDHMKRLHRYVSDF